MEIVIFIGIQASGKTSCYRQRFFDTHVRISLDMVRTRHRERELIDICLKVKQSLVVDNTNLTVEERKKYIDKAKQAGFQVIGYYFRTDLAASLVRNDDRSGKQRIPRPAVLAAHKRLELPSLQEGFDSLYYVSGNGDGGFVIEEWQDSASEQTIPAFDD